MPGSVGKYPADPVRLIAVTGSGQEEDRQKAREAGFDEHLVKPVRVTDLKVVLSTETPVAEDR
jgi:two-component system CheB/CheR fusion protein